MFGKTGLGPAFASLRDQVKLGIIFRFPEAQGAWVQGTGRGPGLVRSCQDLGGAQEVIQEVIQERSPLSRDPCKASSQALPHSPKSGSARCLGHSGAGLSYTTDQQAVRPTYHSLNQTSPVVIKGGKCGTSCQKGAAMPLEPVVLAAKPPWGLRNLTPQCCS